MIAEQGVLKRSGRFTSPWISAPETEICPARAELASSRTAGQASSPRSPCVTGHGRRLLAHSFDQYQTPTFGRCHTWQGRWEMTIFAKWTAIDETMLILSRTLETELRRSHGALFAATFLDEFEPEIRNVVIHSLLSQLPSPSHPPNEKG